MGVCAVCKKEHDRRAMFCSFKCGDWAVENAPELFNYFTSYLIGQCVVCTKRIYAANIRKYCSSDCQRIALRSRNNTARENIPKHIRFLIMSKYNNKCVYCGKEADCIDHVYPVRKGGRTIESNLVAACTPCNSSASGNAFKNIDEKRMYILKKRNVEQIMFEDQLDEFKRPAWHAWVYGGEKEKRPQY